METLSAAKLRQRAQWCRLLAQGPCSERLALELEDIARQYEYDAEMLAPPVADHAPAIAATRVPEIARASPRATSVASSMSADSRRREEVVAAGD